MTLWSLQQLLGRARCWTVACAWLLLAAGTPAQVIQLRAGSSSLLGAHGGSVELHQRNFTGRLDVGFEGGPVFGLSFSTVRHGVKWGLGDQAMPFALPTDIFNHSHYFLGRGLSAERKNSRSHFLIFAGAISTGTFAPFLSAARTERGVALIFYERQLSSSLRFTSHNIISSRQTSIQALEWKPREDMKMGASAGIGSNQGYGSASAEWERDWVSLQAGYARVGNRFRRVRVSSPVETEMDRENIQLQFRPRRNVVLTLNRQNFLSPDLQGPSAARATVNGLGVYAGVGGFRLSGSAFRSSTAIGNSTAMAFGAQRQILPRLEAGIHYTHSRTRSGIMQAISASFKETLTRKLNVSQLVNFSQGRTSVSVGGSFTSNRLSISVEHQTVFMPFLDRNHSAFHQVLLLSLRLQLPHDMQLQGATHVSPAGRVRYSSHITSFFYPHWGDQQEELHGPRLSKYVVRGRVTDEMGQPISGAALQIDHQMVFTDSRGLFFSRVKKPRAYEIEVLTEQFMFPARYVVVSAPAVVQGRPEEMAEMQEIVLRRSVGAGTSSSSR